MEDQGVTPTGSGYSAEPEPSCTVSAVPVSIPNAGWQDNTGEMPDAAKRVWVQHCDGRYRKDDANQFGWRLPANPPSAGIKRYQVLEWHPWSEEGQRLALLEAARRWRTAEESEADEAFAGLFNIMVERIAIAMETRRAET